MRGRNGFLVVSCAASVALSYSAAPAAAEAGPITREQLVQLVAAGVDTGLVERLLHRDCVDFEVDAAALLELSPRVPKELLDAAITCTARHPVERAPAPCVSAAEPAAPAVAVSADPAAPAPYVLNDVHRVALLPLRLDGTPDAELTAAFRDEVIRRGVTFELLDEAALGALTPGERSGAKDSQGTVLPAARSAGAQAVFQGSAETRLVLGKPSLHLTVQLVDTELGRQLWSGDGASQGGTFTLDQRRRIAARNALKRLPW